jgi:hypothetical protein
LRKRLRDAFARDDKRLEGETSSEEGRYQVVVRALGDASTMGWRASEWL